MAEEANFQVTMLRTMLRQVGWTFIHNRSTGMHTALIRGEPLNYEHESVDLVTLRVATVHIAQQVR